MSNVNVIGKPSRPIPPDFRVPNHVGSSFAAVAVGGQRNVEARTPVTFHPFPWAACISATAEGEGGTNIGTPERIREECGFLQVRVEASDCAKSRCDATKPVTALADVCGDATTVSKRWN
ncbi:hypothetical protein RJ55_04749 [Drechmeria coniospora]|nr:hypothetical protein RJ55_04749 [Drechmeria coniospora]